MIIEDLIGTLLTELHKIGRTESVVGKPIDVEGTSVVPVCNLAIGFGTGGAEGQGGLVTTKKMQGSVESGGAGGGIAITPVAFVVIDPEGRAHLQSLRHRRASALTKAVDLIPRMADRWLGDDEKKVPKPPASTADGG
ncbi:MAG: spore germination protein GerW family protein [Pseudomonadota bacterium]